MPTILQREGFAFRIWPNDHPPAHVHVEKAGALLILRLGATRDEIALREAYDMKLRDQRRALELARDEWSRLMTAWKEIHGE